MNMKKNLDQLINMRFVDDLVHNWNGSAQAKDAKTGKYVISNHHSAARFGIENPEAVYGYTIQDLDLIMNSHWGDTAKRIEDQDSQIYYTQQMIVDRNRVFLTAAGQIYVHNVNKYPILNGANKVSLILTTNEDITSQISPLELLNLYRMHYKIGNRNDLIRAFLAHIEIVNYFIILPTYAELNVLLIYARYSQLKLVAQHLKVSLKTIDSHLRSLRDKSSINLHELILRIRY